MFNNDYVSIPNEVYTFFEKRVCRLCGEKIIVDEKSMFWDPGYSCAAECSAILHYEIYVFWEDPKRIEIDEEVFEFEYGDNTYKLCLSDKTGYSTVAINPEIGKQMIVIDGAMFDGMKMTEKNIARKIETIRLLK